MIESSDKVNYEMAYLGACVQLDALGKQYKELRAAAALVLDTLDNKYKHSDALDALWELLNREKAAEQKLLEMG